MEKAKKIEPKYMKKARRYAKVVWDNCNTKKRKTHTKVVKDALKEHEKNIKSEAICLMAIIKAGYGLTSPEFKCAMKRFKNFITAAEHSFAIGNAWMELVNANK